jgi:hypothetical protein
MKRRTGIQQVKKKGAGQVTSGLISIMIEVTPEVKARIERCARHANMSASEAGGVLLEFEMNKKEALGEIIREMVRKAFDEEVDRVESLLEPFLSPPLLIKGEKGLSN